MWVFLLRLKFVLILFCQFSCIVGNTETGGDLFERSSLTGFNIIDQIPGEPFSPIDYQNAESLMDTSPPEDERDPIELANLFEGDILLTNLQWQQFIQSKDSDRNAIKADSKKWIGGVIPYMIASQFSVKERSIIARAFLEYQNKTCITFRPRIKEKDYIYVVKGRGCSCPVGRQGGVQPLTLGDGCVYTGIAVHELMHAAGFWHEQSRDERDDHIDINFKNISPGMEFNFKKQDNIQNLSVHYDTSSILHYGPFAFAKDRRYPTIVPRIPDKNMGQRDGLSEKDVLKIRRLYNCDGEADKLTTTATTPEATKTTKKLVTCTTKVATTFVTPASNIDNHDVLTATSTLIPSTTNPTGTNACEDNHKYCNEWSNRGQCTQNSAWMRINCRRSCDNCDTPCSDQNTYCSSWAAKGECSRNPDYMIVYCPRSCGQCQNVVASSSTQSPLMITSECRDKDLNCSKWADLGECNKNYDWMLQNCAKSCKCD
ncbi:unnamed protein product [Allacma fusca]|uniref:Metalloendopeptidase n=1 Tax=Allacma fusca TaxID=39272 RepID=A0A8J2P5F0_9HEXA|nr:unnamed protein product [Allacma fusca]